VTPDIAFVPPWGGAVSPFSSPPVVVVSLTGIQATAGPPDVLLMVQNVQAEEFNIRVDVNGTCALGSLWVTWVAHDTV